MLGAIAGDIIGSPFQSHPMKKTDFPLFSPDSTYTDDTVLTIAVAEAILRQSGYAESLKAYGRMYPDADYGGSFYEWIFEPGYTPYNSWGNGSAMRVSPVGFVFNDLESVLREARRSAEVTHNHREGIKGGQATAMAIFLARVGENKETIRKVLSERFRYNLNRTVDDIRPGYKFDVSCQGSVPEAIIAFLDSSDFEEAIRLAVSLGGDSDTQACIAGGIAQAYYKVIPATIKSKVREFLPEEFLNVLDEFNQIYSL